MCHCVFVPLCCCSSLQFSSNYLKKVLDENAAGDDTIRLLRFLCWENWDMSLIVLNELLSQVRGGRVEGGRRQGEGQWGAFCGRREII